MEVVLTFKTVVNFYRATQRYIPEDSTLHSQSCENLESFIFTEESYLLGYNSIIAQTGIIFQTVEVFIATTVIISNPT
jgi:hypothetical protein